MAWRESLLTLVNGGLFHVSNGSGFDNVADLGSLDSLVLWVRIAK
jgi:hypothetical protein